MRLGVIGAGNVADLNVAGYLEHPGCQVVAVCDVDERSAREAAKRWGVPVARTDMDDLLGDPDIDAVEILTPTYLHHRHVLDALGAGKHVSVQKPIANSVEEAEELVTAAAGSPGILRVSECFVHYPPLELAKRLVADGAIGRPTGLRIRTVVGQTDSAFQTNLCVDGYRWRLDGRSPGGHLFDDMVHKYAIASWLVDQDVTSVQAVVRRRDRFLEPCVALFEYEDPGLLGTMEVVYAPRMWMHSAYYGADEFFEIQGDEGFIWVTRATGQLLDLAPVVLHRSAGSQAVTRTEFHDVEADWGVGFRRASAEFVDAVAAGRAAAMTPSDALKVLQLCFATYQASERREPVSPNTVRGVHVASGWAET